jgi:branched-chain amino acid transport system ATP-binding protein
VRSGIARTFQNTQLFEEMTAHRKRDDRCARGHPKAGFITAALRLPWTVREEETVAEEAGRLLRVVGLDEWADAPAADLPHGLRRLLEIARALATRPRLLLLDEPAAGLNPAETSALAEALYRIRDRGVTVVIVEHDMGLVMEVSDEIVVLDRGCKIAEGPPRLIQKDPAVIAAYLGEEDATDEL